MIKTLLKSSVQISRRLRLRCLGTTIASPRWLAGGIDSRRGFGDAGSGRIEIAPGAWIELGVALHAYGGGIRIGRDAFLGPYTVIYGHGGVEIGDHTLISMHCRILSSNHTVPPRDVLIRSQPDIKRSTKIGRDVWLGAGVTVLGGVTIGDGCVVGAGAVVSHDLPPASVALGVPAAVVRRRE